MSAIQGSRLASLLLPIIRRTTSSFTRNSNFLSYYNATSSHKHPFNARMRDKRVKYSTVADLDNVQYEKVCSETLESLCDYFEEIVEQDERLKSSDISYGDGVLTINFGPKHGSYVINRQTPNKQIWLSSPTSGPKRYDFMGDVGADRGKWIYKHTGESLHELLQKEIKNIVNGDIDFFKLPFSKI